jgi:starch phosphorylase
MSKSSTKARQKENVADPFEQLTEIAGNLWWTWQPDLTPLFKSLNPRAFDATNQNPIVALRKCTATKRRALERNAQFVNDVRKAHGDYRQYMRANPWFRKTHGRAARRQIAYFCMEYAVHESLPLYAGGLGVLAGDHLKSASDLGLPLVAVGIYWKRGYGRQHIDSAGRQVSLQQPINPDDTPFSEVKTPSGRLWRMRLPLGPDRVTIRAWRADVGRVPLYLLDADLPTNKPRNRKLTHTLYSGDHDTRIRQEILLGIGGWQLLRALKIPVGACHLNEGHAAFLSLERIAERMKSKHESFAHALRYVRKTSVFTTHTPVPAGNEVFAPDLVDRYLFDYQRKLGLTHEQFHNLARVIPDSRSEKFGMTPLALRTSRYANGVAQLHGEIARKMWSGMFPKKKAAAVPIGHVTNGIHLQTWLHPSMNALLSEYLGTDWTNHQDEESLWKRAARIPDDALWSLHRQLKTDLITFCRQRIETQLRRDPVRGMNLSEVKKILDPDALTIGFARRFATYKRATLIFSDAARLAKILNNKQTPVQLIFAGKAHPADTEGQALVAEVVRFSRTQRFRNRVVFLEDYDMNVARHMVAGVDVWLNNPQRPREASGTSGMKPALHGGLNLSILDGWWPEGFNGNNGWKIGSGQDHRDRKKDDARDAEDLYKTLEKQVVPLHFKRTPDEMPTPWIARMKNAIQTIPPTFNSHRQVKEYLAKFYLPALKDA